MRFSSVDSNILSAIPNVIDFRLNAKMSGLKLSYYLLELLHAFELIKEDLIPQ